MIKKTYISNFIAGAALIVSIIVLGKDCSQDKKIDKTNYSLAQIQFKPQIKIVKTQIIGFDFHSDFYLETDEEYLSHDTIDSKAELELNVRFHITNIGNTPAKIFGEICTDNTSSKRFIKTILKKQEHKNDTTPFINDYYSKIEISNGDTLEIERNFKIKQINDKMFTLHYLLLYRNDLNQYFDTYYWARFKCNELIFKEEYYPESQIVRFKAAKKDIIKMVEFVDDMNYSDIYSNEEKIELDKFVEKLTPANML